MCEVLQQGQISCKMSTESGLGHYQRQFKFKSPTTYYLLRENTDDLNVYQTANAYILWSPLQYKLYKFNNDYKELSSKQLDYLVEQRCHGVMEERKGMTILCKCSRIFFFFLRTESKQYVYGHSVLFCFVFLSILYPNPGSIKLSQMLPTLGSSEEKLHGQLTRQLCHGSRNGITQHTVSNC